ncbi:metal-sensing transcriptional repressor [Pseudoxanthomonas wuyuanensis]
MAHVQSNRKKLLARIRRVKGQVSALESSLEAGADCIDVLTQAAAVRGAAHSLLMELLHEHLREHAGAETDEELRMQQIEEAIQAMRSYL